MPAKHPPQPGTLASFAECGRPVFIVCENCKRFTRPRFQEIAQLAGWGSMVQEVGKRMRCGRCDHRGARFTLDRPRGRVG